jgi:serine-threonine kinase receptor-associated protein
MVLAVCYCYAILQAGMEKKIRIFNLDSPDSSPEEYSEQASGIRSLTWLQDDNLLLCSLTDKPGLT